MSFKDFKNGTIEDSRTGLVWQKHHCPDELSWQEAINYCTDLKLAGHTDWRLPSLRELKTIVEFGEYHPAIDLTYFPRTKPSLYWSSTNYAYLNNYAWGVNFNDGGDNEYNKLNSTYVRAVRGIPLDL